MIQKIIDQNKNAERMSINIIVERGEIAKVDYHVWDADVGDYVAPTPIPLYGNFINFKNRFSKSIYQIAKDLKLNRGRFTDWKNGIPPSGEIVDKLAKYFNVDKSEFYSEEVTEGTQKKPETERNM